MIKQNLKSVTQNIKFKRPAFKAEKMNGETDPKWYALYTRSRWEKKVNTRLLERNITTYCPLQKVQKQWSDRKKIIEEPLFRSYVFVKVTQQQQALVRSVPGVVNFVYWQGKPAVIRDEEMRQVQEFLSAHTRIERFPLEVSTDKKIRIASGPFQGQEGTLIREQSHKAVILLEKLGCILVADIK